MAHGNSKHDGEFKRTMPSVIDKVKDHVGSEGAKKLYRTMVCSEQVEGNMQGVANPRNSKQLSSHLDGFVKQLTLYPDLVAVVSLPEIITQFNQLLDVKSDEQLYLSYDTTFNLGDCYVSAIVFKHILFKETPLIPLAFVIHDRKFGSVHETLFNFFEICCSENFQKRIPIVVDREAAPSDIISYLKTAHVNTPQLSSPSAETTETVENLSDSKTEHSTPTTPKEKDTPVINTMFEFPAFVSSQHALAKYIVDNNLITLVPSQAAFIVQGQNGKYCVTLFPKKTCQCPSTTTCFHILAAKMSIGQEPIEKRPVVSRRVLTKNNRKRVDKKSGKKQPRQNDYDPVVEPAPDSAYLVNTPKTPSQVHSTQKSPQKSSLKTKSKTPHSKKKLHFNLETVSEEEIDTCPISPDEKKDNIITLDDTPPGKKRKLDFPSPPISIEIEQEKNNHG
ncbi:unnamed protein product [Mytilus edulis]|uniref:SWIM-type domain-containing protein n=1 Tax=Mytilus edulis TaxID=6550 RepID=A0A8S3URM8_MYTED|nr:unnamed protein product [Mytilus edulis]